MHIFSPSTPHKERNISLRSIDTKNVDTLRTLSNDYCRSKCITNDIVKLVIDV